MRCFRCRMKASAQIMQTTPAATICASLGSLRNISRKRLDVVFHIWIQLFQSVVIQRQLKRFDDYYYSLIIFTIKGCCCIWQCGWAGKWLQGALCQNCHSVWVPLPLRWWQDRLCLCQVVFQEHSKSNRRSSLLQFLEVIYSTVRWSFISCVMCHVSSVMCHVSWVMCHASCVIIHLMCHVSAWWQRSGAMRGSW